MKTTSPVSLGFLRAFRITGDLKPFSQLRQRFAVAAIALAAFALRAHASGLALQPAPTNGLFGFIWQGDSNVTYTVQSTTNIGNPDSWATEEPVKTNNVGPIRWMAPEALTSRKFFRLLLPQPAVSSIEPSAVVTGGLQTLYLTGELFTSNDIITIGGVVQTNVQFINSSLISVIVDTSSFTPDAPGGYQVQFTSGSDNQTRPLTYAWSLVSSPASSSLLLEPPQSPPASPTGKFTVTATLKLGMEYQTMVVPSGNGPRRGPAAEPRGASLADFGDGNAQLAFFRTSLVNLHTKAGLACDRTGGDCDDHDPAVHPWAAEVCDRIVHSFSGEVQLQVVDMAIPGRCMDFAFTRTYRSRTCAFASGVMGPDWTHGYDISASQTATGGIAVADGTGRNDVYALGTNGLYYRDQFFNTGSLSNGAFVLTFPDTSQWLFNPFDATATAGKISSSVDRNGNHFVYLYGGAGELSAIVDDLNRTNLLTYNSSGQLAAITDFTGRSVTYTYYSGEPGGSPGDLKSVTSPPVTGTPNGNDFPLGKTTTYTYSSGFKNPLENHLLLSITDPKGQTAHQFVYQHNQTDLEFLRCVSEQCGATDEVLTYSYLPQTASPANAFAVMRCIINDAVGNVTECFYDSRNRLVQQDDYTGRATPGVAVTDLSNRPTGKLRPSDPDFYRSQWTWNNDSLCAQQIDPLGITTQMLYERDFNPKATAQKKGDLRLVREIPCCGGVDTDGDGLADLTARIWRMTYDPRFGSDPTRRFVADPYVEQKSQRKVTVKGWNPEKKEERMYVNPRSIARSRLTAQTCGSSPCGLALTPQTCEPSPCRSIISTQTCEPAPCCSVLNPQSCGSQPCSFVTSILDPRGTSVLGTYDSHGNLRETHVPMPVITVEPHVELDYNTFGQLTTITNPADGNGYRRVDTCDYSTTGSSNGYLRAWTVDAQGPDVQITTCDRDNLGAITRCIDARGNDTLYTYNNLEQCVGIQSPIAPGTAVRYTSYLYYDANDNLIQTSWENRDQNGALGSPAFFSSSVSLDVLDCVTQLVQTLDKSHSVTTQYAYDANRNLTLIRSPEAVNGHDANNIVTCQYDERDLPFTRTIAPGLTNGLMTTYSYDADGSCARVLALDPLGNAGPPAITLCAYDGLHRCVSVTDPVGNVSTCAYDACDNPIVSRCFDSHSVKLAETTCAYDPLDRCAQSKDSFFNVATQVPIGKGASVTTYTYAPNSECLSVTDDNGHITRYTYDTADRLASITDPKTNTVSCAYDACDNLLTVTQTDNSDLGGSPQVFVTTRVYDALNRCSSVTDNVGNSIQYAYDSRDNVVQQIDANGHIRGCAYDGLDRCTQTVADFDLDGILNFGADAGLRQTWDDDSRLTAVTDANTNITTYTYDAADRCILKTFPNGSQNSCAYDARGNVLVSTDANTSTITNVYDLCDHVIHRDLAARNLAATTTTFETFTYDGCYRLTLASNDVSRLEFAYDSLGDCVTNKQDGLATTCTYDGVGNCLTVSYPGGRITQYAYDALDEVSSVTTSAQFGLPPSALETYAYEGPDRLGRIIRPNGVNTRIRWNGFENSQGTTGDYGWQQVASVNHSFPLQGVTQILDQRAYTYDRNQNRTSRAQSAAYNVTQPPLTNSWTYDSLNRIGLSIRNTGVWSRSSAYQLDTQGNRITVTNDSTVDTYTRSTVNPPGNFQMDEYTTTPFGTEQYDDNGNLVQDGNTGYIYDCNNRLVTVNDLTSGVAAPVASFSYDALGNRLSQTTYPPSPQLPVTSYAVRAAHSKMNSSKGNRHKPTASDPYPDPPNCCGYSVCAPYEGDPDRPFGSCVSFYEGDPDRPIIESRVGGPNGSVNRVYCWGGDCSPAAAFDASGNPQFYHVDDLGNVLALTAASGQPLERCEYDDYGTPTFLNADGSTNSVPASPSGNPFLFQGMEWDGATGLYYRHAYLNFTRTFQNGRTGRSLVRSGGPMLGGNGYTFDGDNPWSAGCKSTEVCGNGIADDSLGGSAGSFLSQGAQGMLHLHSQGIIHRDLAARNILLDRGAYAGGHFQLGRCVPTAGVPLSSFFRDRYRGHVTLIR